MPDWLLFAICAALAGWALWPFVRARLLAPSAPPTPEPAVSTIPPEILDRLRGFVGAVLQALLDDGRIDADEVDDLREDLVDGLQGLGDGVSLTEAVQWVSVRLAASKRTPAELRADAAEQAAKGHPKRAAKLLQRAKEREAQGQGSGA